MTIAAGTRRLLQDRRTLVTVTAITGNTVHWQDVNGVRSYTPLTIFAAVTTAADNGPEAA
jgi:hypothetical protein